MAHPHPISRVVPFVLLIALAAPALAAEEPTPPSPASQAQAQCLERLADLNAPSSEATAGAEVKKLGPISRVLALGDECLRELRADPDFASYVDKSVMFAVHRDESKRFTRDQRHVILAYVAIWLLTAGFLGFLAIRQGHVKAELARLEAELARAARDAT